MRKQTIKRDAPNSSPVAMGCKERRAEGKKGSIFSSPGLPPSSFLTMSEQSGECFVSAGTDWILLWWQGAPHLKGMQGLRFIFSFCIHRVCVCSCTHMPKNHVDVRRQLGASQFSPFVLLNIGFLFCLFSCICQVSWHTSCQGLSCLLCTPDCRCLNYMSFGSSMGFEDSNLGPHDYVVSAFSPWATSLAHWQLSGHDIIPCHFGSRT